MKTTINSNNFTHSTKVPIRFTDIDIFGHVTNTSYPIIYGEARIDYIEKALGVSRKNFDVKSIVAHFSIDYFEPLEMGDEIEVYTRCAKIGNKSFHLEAAIKRITPEKNENIVSRSLTVIVSYDYQKQKTIKVPNNFIDAMLRFEKQDSVSLKI